MLPRRMILEHYELVREGLGLRFLGPETSDAIDKVYYLGQEFLTLQKEKELLQRERNEIADLFKKKDADKDALKQRGLEVKDKLSVLEERCNSLEKSLSAYEAQIPNIPFPDVPISIVNWENRCVLDLGLDYDEYVKYKRTVLRVLQNYLNEYNSV